MRLWICDAIAVERNASGAEHNRALPPGNFSRLFRILKQLSPGEVRPEHSLGHRAWAEIQHLNVVPGPRLEVVIGGIRVEGREIAVDDDARPGGIRALLVTTSVPEELFSASLITSSISSLMTGNVTGTDSIL